MPGAPFRLPDSPQLWKLWGVVGTRGLASQVRANRAAGNLVCQRLHELVLQEPAMLSADVIVPVPLHRDRYKERGLNQVDVFARPLAKLPKIPYRSILLVRERPRPEQHLLHDEQRWDAVRDAFAIQKGLRVDNLRVLLLDDVMTTGATLDACSRALREAGAESVLGLTIARALRTSNFASGERITQLGAP